MTKTPKPHHGSSQAVETGMTRAERSAAGQALRTRVSRSAHAEWTLPRKQRDPLAILKKSDDGRLEHLLPIRFGRMVQSPFTFLRGAAAIMAHDLSKVPVTGLQVQACGDCHLMNFGLFATPERRLVFDLNDFDESHPAPWEWDLKRLVASFAVAGRDAQFSDTRVKDAVLSCAKSYRRQMRDCAGMSALQVWYQNIDAQQLIDEAPDAESRDYQKSLAEKARRRIIEHLSPKIARSEGGRFRLVDQPPILYHVPESDFVERVHHELADYRRCLSDDRRVLLDRFRFADAAMKVVGIGSVGTRCYITLMISDGNHPLLLQFKEAGRSVLEPYTATSVYDNQGQRVVVGQRLMQSSSDIFLGWVRGTRGRDFYVRQLRDMKMSVPLEGMSAVRFREHGRICGRTLARAHARSGDAAAISGYLGTRDNFDRALAKFAVAYADQTERDHAALVKAVRAGRIKALGEEEQRASEAAPVQ
jgi:uncharacterized protein (DUF2252 family)